MTYRLSNPFTSYRRGIAVVGCGGTGGFAAEGIARLLAGQPGLHLLLIDGDRVEERNLGRQNFYPEDLGRFKSQALAERLARRYHTPVAYSTLPLQEKRQLWERDPLSECALVVGAVDNTPARAAIASHITLSQWWIDAGNGAEFGQLLVGNARARDFRALSAFDPEKGVCHALPLPTIIRPELLVPARRPSCAQAVALGEQGPTINQFMAALMVEAVRRLLEGRLAWWQAHLDLEAGSLCTIPPTPEAVARLTGVGLKKLFERR